MVRLAGVMVGVALVVSAAALLLEGGERAGGSADARPFRPEPAREAFPSSLEGPKRHPTARLTRSRLLYSRAGGEPVARVGPRTEWGTPRVLSVVRHRRGWLAVLAPEMENGRVGWIPIEHVTRLGAVTWSLHVDLSRRELVVRRDGRQVRRLRIGVGRPGHRTPTGRFAVTDRLRVTDPASPYGCCVLALTGHQTRLPPGWPGGDRLAVHATADLSGLGREVSLGCMRSHPQQARWLIRNVPLGSPVSIRE